MAGALFAGGAGSGGGPRKNASAALGEMALAPGPAPNISAKMDDIEVNELNEAAILDRADAVDPPSALASELEPALDAGAEALFGPLELELAPALAPEPDAEEVEVEAEEGVMADFED